CVIAMIFLIISVQFLRFASRGRTTSASFDTTQRISLQQIASRRDVRVPTALPVAPASRQTEASRETASLLCVVRDPSARTPSPSAGRATVRTLHRGPTPARQLPLDGPLVRPGRRPAYGFRDVRIAEG